MTRTHITKAQAYAVAKTIEAAGTTEGDTFEYREGWSDARVAHTHQVTEFAVISMRKELFGKLKVGGGRGSPVSLLLERVKALEARVAQLEDAETKPYQSHSNGHEKVLR